MIRWIIWYHDGSSFSSDDGPPEKAPREGVQVIAVRDRIYGRLLWHGFDNYCWQDDTWVPHSAEGKQQYLWLTSSSKIHLQGFAVSDERFWQIYKSAVEDQRLPAKTNLPMPDAPLPSRFRLYAFADDK